MRIPEGDTGDNSAHQSFGLLLQPAVRLYAIFTPDFAGVMLYLRCLYGAMSLVTAFVAWTLFRRLLPAGAAFAVALLPVAFIPFGLPAPSYNTVAMLCAISSLCLYAGHLVRLWATREGEESVSRSWPGSPVVPVAGAICALGVVAYPTTLLPAVAFFPIAAFLAPSWKAARPLLSLLFFGVVFLSLGAALVLGVFGYQKIAEILAFDRALSIHPGWRHQARLAWNQFSQHPAFPVYCVLGAAVVLVGRVFSRPGVRVAGVAVLLALVAGVLRLPGPSFCIASHDLVFFLAVIGLPLLLDLRLRSALSPARRVLLILYGTGMVGGLVTALPAHHAMFNFPVGGSLAALAVVGYLMLDPLPGHAGEVGRLALPLGSVGALAACSFLTVYGHCGKLSELDSVVPSGPFAGLRTTPSRVTQLEQSREQLQVWEGRCRTVLVASPFTGLYLLTSLKPLTPCSYFQSFRPPAWRWLEARADEPTDLPELIVEMPEPGVVPHPLRANVLAAHYRAVDSPGPTRMFLRRDLPIPVLPLPCPYIHRFDCTSSGTGWSVPEQAAGGAYAFTWMAAREATIRLPKPAARGGVRLRIDVPFGIEPDILDSLKLRVNGRPVPLTVTPAPTRVYEAILTPAVLDDSPEGMLLKFSVDRTVVPPGGDRTLAVGFRALEFSEVEAR
jgi:hypothetical protein